MVKFVIHEGNKKDFFLSNIQLFFQDIYFPLDCLQSLVSITKPTPDQCYVILSTKKLAAKRRPVSQKLSSRLLTTVYVHLQSVSVFLFGILGMRAGPSELGPEDQWSCKRSPDICILFQHYFSNLRSQASCL